MQLSLHELCIILKWTNKKSKAMSSHCSPNSALSGYNKQPEKCIQNDAHFSPSQCSNSWRERQPWQKATWDEKNPGEKEKEPSPDRQKTPASWRWELTLSPSSIATRSHTLSSHFHPWVGVPAQDESIGSQSHSVCQPLPLTSSCRTALAVLGTGIG